MIAIPVKPPARTAGRYKWVALSNTTVGVLMATLNSSIVLISLPSIFRGIGVSPLEPGNIGLLLWMLMGYMVVTAVLVVSLGRLGDMFGRVRMYNLGFAVFTLASILLSLVFFQGTSAALTLIVLRIVQGIGGSLLGPAANMISPSNLAHLTGHAFFPHLISGPFISGLHLTFAFAMAVSLIAAVASWLRGKRYVYGEAPDTRRESATTPLGASE